MEAQSCATLCIHQSFIPNVSRPPSSWIIPTAVVILAAFLGYWLAADVIGTGHRDRTGREGVPRPPRPTFGVDLPNPDRKAQPRHPSKRPPSLEEIFLGTPRERIVRFKDDESYRRFLASLDGKNLRLLGKIDGLRAARIGFEDLDDLDGLLGENDDADGNFLVSIPQLPQVDAQPGAAGFGQATLEWLGITGDNSSWGEGVRVAMLDTGVGEHSALPGGIREIDLITGDGPPIALHGHGTAVASLLVGSDRLSQGIAPSADLLSIRIADDSGNSNSFLLAEGIVRAVDEGAQVINISMGSYGNSSIVKDAVDYALEKNVVIVAAAGNEGLETPSYPAAYEGVIAVGAVDRNGQHLAFSNSGENLDLGAPGFEIVSAWPDDQFTSFSGTSAAAPIVAGAVAATMSQFGPLEAGPASELVLNHLDAAGAPGDDPEYGRGVLDVGRVMNSETPGIVDAAIASNWYEAPGPGEVVGSLLITVENRGTTSLNGATVNVTIGGDSVFPMAVSVLQPGQTQVLTLPVNVPSESESIAVNSVLTLSAPDSKPSNNSLGGAIVLTERPASQSAPGNFSQPPGPVTPRPDAR